MRVLRHYAVWAASRPQAEGESLFSRVFKANARLGRPSSLKVLKRLASKVKRMPGIDHYRDPIFYFYNWRHLSEEARALQVLSWRGAFALGCFAASLAILHLMAYLGTTTVNLSERDLADLIGVTCKTARKYLRALCGAAPRRAATVPVVLHCRSARLCILDAYSYTLRPRAAWRVPAVHTETSASQKIP
jgi:hypothetical protein